MALSGRQLQALQQLIRQQQTNDDGLLGFRAGRMTMDDSKMVTAKTERGKIKFSKSDDGILHLEWINRISKKSGMDIMIFPDSAKWVKVDECKDGRVYVLKFNGSSRREFFWMQEPTDEKDNEITEKINKLISGDTGGTGAGGAGGASGAGAGMAAQQAQIAQSLGLGGFGGGLAGLGALGGLGGFAGLGGAAARGTGGTGATQGGNNTGGTGASGNPNDQLTQLFMNALQQQLGGTGAGAGAGAGAGVGAGGAAAGGNGLMQAMLQRQLQQREELRKEPDLSDILDPSQKEIENVLDDEKTISRLAEHLPEEMRDCKSILEQLSSPQFLGSLARLNHIINSPQMTLLLGQMGIQAGDKIGVRAFIDAVLKQASGNDNGNNNGNNNDGNNGGSNAA